MATSHSALSSRRTRTPALALAALGVVYGDIGTSPLYAIRECFQGAHPVPLTPANILGVLSLIFWSLILVVSIKYIALILRADNDGEGGILALMALAFPEQAQRAHPRTALIFTSLGVFGAAMLYGDGTITPVITVLSAMEGLQVVTPLFKPWIVPLTVAVLVGLFALQRVGTGGVGRAFGPVMLVWFVAIGLLGTWQVAQFPGVIHSINPLHGLRFLFSHGWTSFLILSAVFLVLTGAEALYADMGHFGRHPIRLAWFGVVLPALFLNYLGQGALLLSQPEARANPFYGLAHGQGWLLYPLVILATAAAIIASQALISGAFSLTVQAIQLGYSPRMQIEHTSGDERGQVYVPQVNWLLLVACLVLTVRFRDSSELAGAYGMAVVVTMIITTLLFHVAVRRVWGWAPWKANLLCTGLLLIELAFLGANLTKLLHFGWLPVALATVLFGFMYTWKSGRRHLREALQPTFLPLDLFLEDLDVNPPLRVPGTAVFMTGTPGGTPLALLHNLKHNKVLHGRVVILSILTAETPHVTNENRVQIQEVRPQIFQVVARFGFMEDPTVPIILDRCREIGLVLDIEQSSFFLSRESIIPRAGRGLRTVRGWLFSFMARNAQPATAYFHLPANRVVELGMQIPL